ncbi:MAG: hypothetical protein IKO37_08915, partial [Prevotella sp.]|nr:hypothetical protein [Prevotella sp.]
MDNRHLGVKEVKGFFYLNSPANMQNSTSLRLASIYNIRLVRFHERSTSSSAGTNNNNNNSAMPAERKDSAAIHPKDSFANNGKH